MHESVVVMDQTQVNTDVENRNTGHNISRRKPNGVVKFESDGSMWYREPHEDDESVWSKFI